MIDIIVKFGKQMCANTSKYCFFNISGEGLRTISGNVEEWDNIWMDLLLQVPPLFTLLRMVHPSFSHQRMFSLKIEYSSDTLISPPYFSRQLSNWCRWNSIYMQRFQNSAPDSKVALLLIPQRILSQKHFSVINASYRLLLLTTPICLFLFFYGFSFSCTHPHL